MSMDIRSPKSFTYALKFKLTQVCYDICQCSKVKLSHINARAHQTKTLWDKYENFGMGTISHPKWTLHHFDLCLKSFLEATGVDTGISCHDFAFGCSLLRVSCTIRAAATFRPSVVSKLNILAAFLYNQTHLRSKMITVL